MEHTTIEVVGFVFSFLSFQLFCNFIFIGDNKASLNINFTFFSCCYEDT